MRERSRAGHGPVSIAHAFHHNVFLVVSNGDRAARTSYYSTTASRAGCASVGLSALSPTNGTVWVAEEKGLFKKYGTPLDEAQGERLST